MNDQIHELLNRVSALEKKVDLLLNKQNTQSQPSLKEIISRPAPELPEIPRPEKTPINFLPILAVICFGLAGVFIVKLAIESGWLTPVRQWGLLVLFAVSLTGVGILFEKVEQSYRSYLAAAGLIIFYLSAYSSSLYFDLFSPTMSQVLGAAVSLLGFYLFNIFRNEIFVTISAIGTYISPILLGKEADPIFISAFFLIWAGLYSTMAIYLKSRSLTLLGSYLGLAVFTFLNQSVTDPSDLLIIILVQSLQFVLYAGGVFYYSIKNKNPLTSGEAIAYLPILLFFYATTYFFLNRYDSTLAPWISLGFAGFVYFLYHLAKKSLENLHSQKMVEAFLGVVLFHSGYVQLIPASGKAWLLPLIILGIYISEKKEIHKSFSIGLRFLFSAIAIIEFITLCFRLLTNLNWQNILPAFLTIILGFFYYSKSSKLIKKKEGLFLGLLHILCILALYRLAYEHGSLAVSAIWGLYSSVVLIVGYVKKDAVLAKSSLLILTVTCLKALVYDASQAPSGVRIASLILTGAILYGAGYLFQKIKKWD